MVARKNNKENKSKQVNAAGYWSLVLQRFKRDRLAMTGFILVIFLFIIAILAPLMANNKPIVFEYQGVYRFPALGDYFFWLNKLGIKPPFYYPEFRIFDYGRAFKEGKFKFALFAPIPYSPIQPNLDELGLEPAWVMSPAEEKQYLNWHWMGTDDLGRDVFSRMIHGTHISLLVGFVSSGIALFIGILFGALAGYYGGLLDNIISRFIEVMICFPTFFLILAIIAFLEPSIWNIMIVIGLTSWTSIARYIRGEFLKITTHEYTQAARALGASNNRIIFKHILPNALAPALVSATFGIAHAILTEAGLSMLGIGVKLPTPTWGSILSLALKYMDYWWLSIFPGLAIFLTVTAYNLVGEGLRDALDPRLSSEHNF
ncbi:ABC transporter permease [candidate division CSSED10-310 bacterium]|uniref:ABC transporter permease n=1 Tax=candidate division CSSED10-310 bacterium TaxID=2855610 RepID=A0ABV6YXW0_UNCC1